jgi:hypothetical protein
MIKVIVPNRFQTETKYVLSYLLKDCLSQDVKFYLSSDEDVYIELEGQNHRIQLNNTFFKSIEGDDYIQEKYLPSSSFKWEHKTACVGIYGENKLEQTDAVSYVGMDIIGSAFFMLSRWEEALDGSRDQYERFPSSEAFAVKEGFIQRPIVNEYSFLLKALIEEAFNIKIEIKRSYESYITCDVDGLEKWYRFREILNYAHFYWKKKQIGNIIWTLWSALSSKLWAKDPFDTFDHMMKVAEEVGSKVYFFFIPGGESKFEKRYPITGNQAKDLIKKMKSRGHELGIHPSYYTYKFPEQFAKEVEALRNVIGEVKYGRQHYLRFEVPTTWKLWNEHNIGWDSTLVYADCLGFRAGTCIPFRVFDLETKEVLDLVENPLTIMDQTLITYLKMDINSAIKEVNDYIEIIKKYKGSFVLLWHNSSFNTPEMKPYHGLFERIVKASK